MRFPAVVRGVVFDMDGVLLDSSKIHEAALRAVLEPLGVREFDYTRFAGMRTKDCLKTALIENDLFFSDEQVQKLADQKSALSMRRIRETNPTATGCMEVLTSLARRFKLGLASSGSEQSVEFFVQTNNCGSLFSSVVHGGALMKAKPSPDIYNRSCCNLNLEPRECAAVEDAVAGVQAAKAAGLFTVAIPSTCPLDALLQAGADTHASCLKELMDF